LGLKQAVRKLVLPHWYSKLEISDYSYINDRAEIHSFRSPQTVAIGKYCSIGECKFIVDGDHNLTFVSTFPFRELGFSSAAPENKNVKAPPVVGNDCWVCDHAVIYGGVTVGHGAVVAGGAVVASDVPAYALVAGNPARVVRYRFDQETIERLLRVAWWDLPHKFVCDELAPVIADVDEFLTRAEGFTNL
jgi:acetyltransferase-like isoleucine patch superfamily enzyme